MPTAFVVHGASNRNKEEFEAAVRALAARLGAGWKLVPVWWGGAGVSLELVKAGLPYVLPPKPGFLDEQQVTQQELWGPTIGEAGARGSLDAEAPAADALPGAALAAWNARRLVLTNVHRVAADVSMYWHRSDEIQQSVLAEIGAAPGQSINVVAHSLGAIITVDLLLSRRLSISGLVSFGTPVAAAHVLDPTRNIAAPFRPGQPVVVRDVQRWTNLWNHYDPIGFRAGGVFRTGHGAVEDRESELPDDVPIGDAHGSYWGTDELVTAIKETCF